MVMQPSSKPKVTCFFNLDMWSMSNRKYEASHINCADNMCTMMHANLIEVSLVLICPRPM